MTTQVTQRTNTKGDTVPLAARALLTLLTKIQSGTLLVTLPDSSTRTYGAGTHHAAIRFHDWKAISEILTGGDIAFAQGYIDHRWDSPDLPALLTLAALNQKQLMPAFYGRWWSQLVFRFRHALRKNTKAQAKKNIVAHYDLGNDFYELWLDETMSYSSAIFGQALAAPLVQAQTAKYERALTTLRLAPGSHILEIGCGWGGFIEHAARQGYRVTGLTLSPAQLAHAQARVDRAGLTDRVHLFLRDYRDHKTRVDGIVSIEMIEAVGERFWNTYFRSIFEALKPGGRACIQGITIDNARFDQYRMSSDFIQQYIFPGGMLPSPFRLESSVKKSGLLLEDSFWFGRDYAETLRRWLTRFDAHVEAVRAQGKSEAFIRMWRFYLAYCIAGFEANSTNVGQFTLFKP